MSLITDLSERWRALFNRDRADRELDDELAFHLEQDAAARIARGADPEAARRDALIELGGMAHVKEEVHDARGTRPLEDLAGDIRYAIRLLRSSPIFSLTVIGVLGGAIGAAI